MKKFNFKKKYGQNFLTNEKIADKIVDTICPQKEDIIIEIGAGGGFLTKKLKKFDCTLIAFEIDKETNNTLEKLVDNKTKIIYEDFLSVNLTSLLSKYEYKNLFYIGNLPYYISTAIIEHILDCSPKFASLTFMVQKELGERILAKPGSRQYGYLTVILNFWFNMEKIIDVKRYNFYPIPNVDSVVIKLTTKNQEKIDYLKFKKFVKSAFQFKRKTLKNNLKDYNLENIERILNKYNFSLQNRAEELTYEVFITLINEINL